MPSRIQPEKLAGIGLAVLLGVLCFFAGLVLADTQNMRGLVLVLGLILFITVFLWPEAGLYILLLSMLLGPEIIVGNLGGGGTSAGRGITLRVDDFLLLIIMVTWVARGAVYKDVGLFTTSRLNRPIAVYLAIVAVSTAIGMMFDRVRPDVGFFYVLKFIEYVVVFFAAVNYIQSKEHLKRLIGVAFFTAIVVSLIGMAQIPMGVRVSAPFEGETGEPNTLGGYLLFMMSIFGGLLVSAPNLRKGLQYALGIVVMMIPFIYTLSRASYLGILLAGPTVILFSRRKGIAAFSMATFFLALLLFAPPELTERIQYTFGGQGIRSDQIVIGNVRLDTSTTARIESIGSILDAFPQHPILGYGVTGFGFVDGQFPRVLIETGLAGMAAFLWLLFSLVREGRSSLSGTEEWWERGICIGYLAGLVGLIGHAAGSNTFIIVRIMEPFWFFTGAVVLFPLLRAQASAEEEPEAAPAEPAPKLLRPWSA